MRRLQAHVGFDRLFNRMALFGDVIHGLTPSKLDLMHVILDSFDVEGGSLEGADSGDGGFGFGDRGDGGDFVD
jgi:hypothetical protein